MKVRITEHTNSDEPWCIVDAIDGTSTGEFYGSIEEFRERWPDIEIVEEVWD